MKPHKHAELIKAWADGAVVEWKCSQGGTWHQLKDIMSLVKYDSVEYRIKPHKVLQWRKDTMPRQQQTEIDALKAHPVKELTNECLDNLTDKANKDGFGYMYIAGLIDGFEEAKAILRKAKNK